MTSKPKSANTSAISFTLPLLPVASTIFCFMILLLQHPSDPSPIIAQGECDGKIIYEEKGENGFGYDSLFFSPEKDCTFAELETVEKKKISHRAKALAVLKSKLTA